MAAKRQRDRRFPPIWYTVLLLIPVALIVWIRSGDRMGDAGLTNVMSAMLTFLFVLLLGIWFVFFSGFTRKVRYLSLLGAVGVVVLFGVLFRYEGVGGTMVPSYAFRFADRDELITGPAAAAKAGVDLLSQTENDFPGFLGPQRDVAVEHVRLTSWADRAPERLWRQPIGPGWSAFSVVNGIAVTMEQRGEEELVTAYDAATGELLWSRAHAGRFEHFLGGIGPRSTPLIHAGRVYALGARGWLVSLDGATGEVIWERDLLDDYGITPAHEYATVMYGRSNSPLIHGHMLIVPAGGVAGERLASLAAFDRMTGEPLWEGGTTQISHSSPRFAHVAGADQILIVNEDTLSGHDPVTGRLLWEHPWPGVTAANASSSQAVPVAPDRVFVSKGYGEGAALLQLSPTADGMFEVREIWKDQRVLRTKFTNVVMWEGHVYGLSDGILECVELATGRRAWKSGRYHHGQILRVGGRLLVLSEDGELSLVELTSDEPNKVLGSVQALDGKTWNNLALYGDLLLIRNGREATAFRLSLGSS